MANVAVNACQALATLDMIGYITRLSQWGGGEYIIHSNDFYLPSRLLEEGGGGRHPVVWKLRNIGISIGNAPVIMRHYKNNVVDA